MRIVTVRRISQAFFLVVFLWFCVTATLGRPGISCAAGPSTGWILDLDPLTALATVLATGTLYATLAWSLVALALTLFVGRFFCGFACPLGTLNQFTGWLGRLGHSLASRVEANRHRRSQALKYYLLVGLLALALMGSVQTGIFDPLPLMHRSVNLALAPLADNRLGLLSDEPRRYASVWLLGVVFLGVLGLNLVLPRFFCRFVCPLGGLFGLLSRFAPWRIGKTSDRCGDCRICEEYCEGACRPSGTFIGSECVMCMNCLDRCPAGRVTFATKASAAGEVGPARSVPARPDRGRRRAAPGLHVAGRRPGRAQPQRRPHPAPRGPGRGALPGPLPPLRPVHAHLPGQHHPARPVGGRRAGPVDPGHQLPHQPQRLPAQLHRLRPGLPHRGHPAPEPGRKTGPGRLRRPGADPHGHGLRGPGPLSALGHGPALPGLSGIVSREPQGHLRPHRVRDHPGRPGAAGQGPGVRGGPGRGLPTPPTWPAATTTCVPPGRPRPRSGASPAWPEPV